MNQLASLLMPSVLPTAASALASAREMAVPGKNFEATFAQFLTLLPTLNAEQSATAPTADSTTTLLSVFGIAPDTSAKTQSDASPGILSAPALSEAIASPDLVAQGLALVGQVAAQLTSSPATEQAQALLTATTKPQSNPASTVLTRQLGLRGTVAEVGSQPENVKQPEAKAPQTPDTPAALIAPPKHMADPPGGAKSLAPAKPASAAKAAPAAKGAGPQENPATSDGKPVSQRQSETTTALAPAAQSIAPVPQPQANAAEATPSAQSVSTTPAAPSLPLAANVQTNVTIAAAPQAGVPLGALAVHIARTFESGSQQFEIRLHPAELGRLDISLTVADDGHVQAVLRAERPETLDLLQRDARALEQQLRQAGLDVGSNALSFSLSGGNGQRQAPFAGWPAFADAQDVAGAAKEEAAATYMAVRVRDGIDIRV